MSSRSYCLLDSGYGEKLEQFGEFRLIRPCPQAIWPTAGADLWKQADARFTREEGWRMQKPLPSEWEVELDTILFRIAPTDFGHLGVFPEHAKLWGAIRYWLKQGDRFLNGFAYSGGATLAAAQVGAQSCHLDASKGMVAWARENSQRNGLEKAPIRWIVEDAVKFLKRELKRGVKYDGILLDPPTFGRGSQGEVFKIEKDLFPLLEVAKELLTPHFKFLMISCHTPGFTPLLLRQILGKFFTIETVRAGELSLGNQIPSGCYAVISNKHTSLL